MVRLSPEILCPCDIIFTFDKTSWLSNLIWKLSLRNKFSKPLIKKEKMSHTLLYLGDGLILDTDIMGVSIKTWKRYASPKYKIHIGRVVSPFDKKTVIEAAKDMAGMKTYAFKQLFFLLMKKIFNLYQDKDVDDGVTCSEAISSCFQIAGISFDSSISTANISPLDIYNSKIIEKINVG